MPLVISKIKVPLLLIMALLIILSMLRLGIWQLDRAQQKKQILDQVSARAQQDIVPLQSLLADFGVKQHRFRAVEVSGAYIADKSVLVDNQVFAGQVGYRVFTPLRLAWRTEVVMVDRGWISVGESRVSVPKFETPSGNVVLSGRLNTAPAQPPLWNDDYPVAQGAVWAYLPLDKYASQMQLKVLPLVLELAPEQATDTQFKVAWSDIDDEWVAKHSGYAFQWFAMALAFFIACLVLLIRQLNRVSD